MGGDVSIYDGLLAGLVVVVGWLSMRSDRTKNIADAASTLVAPLQDRIKALEAEMAGMHKQVEKLEAENRTLKGRITRLQNHNAELRLLLNRHGITPPPNGK